MDVRVRNNITIVGAESGPVVLLAHGFGCDQNLWRPVVERLASDFRLVLFDHVGAGASDPRAWNAEKYSSLAGYTADVVDILRDLDLRDIVYVGHSVASIIGALAAIAEPTRISRLVMLSPSPRYVDDGDYRGGFTRADIDELLDSMELNYLGWSHTMAGVVMDNPDRPELGAELERSFCRTDPERARVFARTTFLSDNRADLAHIPVPTLIVECARDAIAPREVGAFVHQQVPNSRLITLDAVGHCPHMSAPDATARAIRDFVQAL